MTAFFGAMTLVCLLGGCDAAEGDSAASPPQTTACPDSLVQVDRMFFSTAPYEPGQPENAAASFSRDQKVVYATVLLTDDLCCTRVSLVCQYQGETVFQLETDGWLTEGTTEPQPRSFGIQPSGGFKSGEYTVRVFIDIREIMDIGFRVT